MTNVLQVLSAARVWTLRDGTEHPSGPFSLYLRAYWPERPILDGTWTPPPVTRFR